MLAGLYEYGRGTSVGKRAVAYVSPRGQHSSMPEDVRDLPVVRASAKTGLLRMSTVVVFGPEAAFFSVYETDRSPAPARRVSARASEHDQCSDNYFCLFELTGQNHNFDCWVYNCDMVQFGPFYTGKGWFRLGDYNFNDRASSMYQRRDRDSLLAKDWTGSTGAGTRYCAESHSQDDSFGNNAIGNDQASAFANTPDDIHC
jgi:hypothetical protein